MSRALLLQHAAEVLDLIPAGVYIVDTGGVIQLYNERAAELWGHRPTPGDAQSRFCGAHRLYTLDGAPVNVTESPIAATLADGQPRHHLQFIVERPDGSRIHAQAHVTSLRDEHGRILGAINCFQDVTERVRIADELRRQLDVTRAITDHAADCLFLMDARGVATFANPAAVSTFGFTTDELLAKPLHDLIHHTRPDGAPYPMSECPLGTSFTRGQTVRNHEDIFFHNDGRRIPVSCSNAPIFHEGKVVAAVLVVRDMSERRRAEHEIGHRARSLQLLSDTATRLLMADRPEDLLKSVFDDICSHLRCSHYFNFLVTDDGARLRLHAYAGIDANTARDIQHMEFGQSLCGTTAQSARAAAVEDVQNDHDPRLDLVRSFGITTYACHPLVVHAKVIGTLSFGASDRIRFSPEDLDLIRTACDQIAMAIERSRLNVELQRRNAELSAANAAKDQFLAALSHELRTPLTPVLMAASALEGAPDLPEGVRDDIAMIRQNVELEARLIDDLLDLTRITRGKLSINPVPVDAHDLIRQTFATCCAQDVQAKHLSVTFALDAAHFTVHADPARLQQVLWNLLKNAVKFTPRDGRLTIRTSNGPAMDGKPSSLTIEVQDTGIGIPPDILPGIFNAFDQGNDRITRQFGGLGLGLAISKAITDLHGGSLVAHSDGPGTGSTFALSLPAVPSPAPAPLPPVPETVGDDRPADPLRILVVEDHQSTAALLVRLLRASAHDVHTCGTVADALDILRSTRFDLLISDLGLPDGSGLDLLAQLDGQRPRRAIALSGYGMEHDIRATRDAGFAAHLTKPIDLQQLHQTIAEVMSD